MRTAIAVLLAVVHTSVLAAAPPAYAPKAAAGPHKVQQVAAEWRDAARDRVVPVRIYIPSGDGPFPLIVYSHGLGGSRDGNRYVGTHWASHGYICAHIQHKGSDSAVWKGAGDQAMAKMRQAAAQPENAVNRPKDVSFAIDMLTAMNAEKGGRLAGRIDLEKIGVGGHSFGAFTALASTGRVLVPPFGKPLDLTDKRIKACLPMSAPGRDTPRLRKSYADYATPCLHMTGTKDDSIISNTKAADRRCAFDAGSKGDQYLLILRDAEHMTFGDSLRRRDRRRARHHELILQSGTAFWDAYLKGDAAALKWLAEGGFQKALGREGTFEVKQPAP
jgi:dienelactone hydrolase